MLGNESPHTDDNDGQMASSRSTPVSRESPAVSRAFEEETSEIGASSSATKDEIPRSESSNDKASENGAFPFLVHTLGVWVGIWRFSARRLLFVLQPGANHV